MKIQVTPEDIVNGKPRSSENCPVALALRRAVLGHFEATTNERVSVEVEDGNYQFTIYKLTWYDSYQCGSYEQIDNFIEAFDNRNESDCDIDRIYTRPFELELEFDRMQDDYSVDDKFGY